MGRILLLIVAFVVSTGFITGHECYSQTEFPTPLVKAILSHDRDEVKRLLDSGANPNEYSSDGLSNNEKSFISTPLSWAASDIEVCDIQILRLLIDHGANPNLTSPAQSFMFGPLNSAIRRGCITDVAFLLQNGANPNAFDGIGKRTSLFVAIYLRSAHHGKWESDLEMEKFGDTTQGYRVRVYDTIIARLLKYGASPTLADSNGSTPLHAAAEFCDSILAEQLISLGAPLTSKDNDGDTPEDIAKKNCPSVLAVIQRYKK